MSTDENHRPPQDTNRNTGEDPGDFAFQQIDHIGIAVRDLNMAIATYQGALNIDFKGTEEVAQQKVMVAKFTVGGVMIELLQPTHPESPIARFLEKKGEGMHHIAYRVRDIDGCLRDLSAKGVSLIDERARIGVGGSRIAFIHPRGAHGVLTELVEREK
jgi:methylmalonyl-CoA/ethylmalonyl-CoA epimerase